MAKKLQVYIVLKSFEIIVFVITVVFVRHFKRGYHKIRRFGNCSILFAKHKDFYLIV